MSNIYFITGFPGFIASSLTNQLIQQHHPKKIYFLVLANMIEQARQEIERISKTTNYPTDQLILLAGDITKLNLSLDESITKELSESVTHVFHLAAVYDLAVPEKLAHQVNVEGTRNVNQWLTSLNRLKKYIYFSTAYVSGKRNGNILETELEMGQSFKNHYEKTKYEAEVLVRQAMETIPTIIIRPGIVVGHSKTGETIKFDGLYFMLNVFERLKFLPWIPYLGDGNVPGNFVPVDYIVNATLYLAHLEQAVGKTYHLTDPNPYTMRQIYQMLMKEYLNREPKGTIPLSLAKWFFSIPLIRKWLHVEKEALDYFTYNVNYDCTEAIKDLTGSNISCPDFKEIISTIVRFYHMNKNDLTKQVKIR
ncbi:SDR family oxidoreductase [Thermolongibacillus altinsuensis]|uniref:SDR family oxidoreductase n=1 Tax=Thermolongibacillus altinsuensis TaxID=575256 RepID=UPI00242A2ADD|nr:SDR family oxidoreductase [Thermolongibacillus altinsuensis]GMB09950.1 3-beta hydroxysteroid dehydrogenase [Thermolongibacillus altinsuensis]